MWIQNVVAPPLRSCYQRYRHLSKKFLKTLRILFVEDEPGLREGLKKAIGGYFFSFLTAKDATEALELFQSTRVDVVITDITMPNKSGLEMAQEIKAIDSTTPLIVISAYSEPEKFLGAIDVGVVKYFLKPFDPAKLLSFIESLEERLRYKNIPLCGGFTFDATKKSLYKNGKYVKLTQKEREFLSLLHKRYIDTNPVVKPDEINKLLWGDEKETQRLRTFIKRLRAKTSKEMIQTVRGEGYTLGHL